MRMMKEVFILNIDDILPNRMQPRIRFDENAILELSESIKKHGVIQPIIVRRIADKYEIIAGERRYKASIVAGRKTIPAIVTDINDKDSAEIALIENIQREDMSPIEEALSYKKILDMGYLNQSELALKLGKTQSTIANKLRLLNLSDEVQEALLEGKISERHARSLLRVEKNLQKDLLNRIINERMTVRKTDQMINELINKEAKKEEKEKGDNMNNNDINNNFNIPTGQIIDSMNGSNQNQVNPGFMNIDAIQNNAQDINSTSSQPFDPFGIPNPLEGQPIDVTPQPVLQSNPFDIPAPAVEQQPQVDMMGMAPQPGVQSNPFDIPTPTVEQQPQVDMMGMAPQPVLQSNPFDIPAPAVEQQPQVDMMGMAPQPEVQSNPFDIPAPTVEQQPQVDMMGMAPQPEVQSNPFDIPAPAVEQQPQVDMMGMAPQPEVQSNPFNIPAPAVEQQPQVDMMGMAPQPEVQSNPFNIPAPAVEQQPQVDMMGMAPQPVLQSNPFDIPAPAVEQQPQVDMMGMAPQSENNGSIFSPMPNYPLPEESELKPLMPEDNIQQIQKPELPIIINKVRDCIKEIEAQGYKVDIDELDFDTNYQFTIKIEK